MHDLILRRHKDWLVNQRTITYGLCYLLVLASLSSFAQPSSLAPMLMTPQQQVKWSTGPVKVELGAVAEMDLPEGCRFADPDAARTFLGLKALSPNLLGILVPESGAWTAILEFTNSGYMTPAVARRINADDILKGFQSKIEASNSLRRRQRTPELKSVKWELAPEYEIANDSIAYAFQLETATDRTINPSFRFFGRYGVLAVSVFQKGKAVPDVATVKEIFSTIAFKPGQRYADHQEGEQLAGFDTYQMITGDDQPAMAPVKGWRAFFNRRTNLWIVSILGVVVFVLVIYLVTKEIRSITTRQSFRAATTSDAVELKLRKAKRPLSEADLRHRRAFDYQKFYSDMMMQVSTRSYTGMIQPSTEDSVEEVAGTSSANSASAQVMAEARGAASELIARQKDLIEEQRRLMQQQTKLIEERSKLIEEKNQLLAKQSEMMDHLL